MRWLRWALGALVLVILGGVLQLRAWQSKWRSPSDLVALDLEVSPGDTAGAILRRLEADHGLGPAKPFYYFSRYEKLTGIKTGRYRFDAGTSPREILVALSEGRVATERFTIPEGLNRWQVRDLLDQEGWIPKDRFDALCDSESFLAQHGIEGPGCEGYLFPETYTLAAGTSPEKVFEAMFNEQKRVFSEILAKNGRGPQNLTDLQLLTLASIVEKETGAPQERPQIACVFYNRIKAEPQWKLQTDPTVIYAATLHDPSFDGNLKRFHLYEFDHPYNTYQRKGLPPGPIANPGAAALEAVTKPLECGDYFFVSKNDGTHIFCPTLECHERNVQKWQVEYFRGR